MADNNEVRTNNKEEHSTVAGVEVITRRKRRVVVPQTDETPITTQMTDTQSPQQSENLCDWVNSYEQLATKLLDYQNDRKTLIEKLKKIYEITQIPTYKFHNDIDPFTVFSLFNRRLKKRVAFIKELNAQMNIIEPTNFCGLPLLSRKNAFYDLKNSNNVDIDINNLWKLFSISLEWSKNNTPENKESFITIFNQVMSQKGIGNSLITMGLFWIRPNTFISLDENNQKYILNHNIIDTISKNKITAEKYLEICEKCKDYCNKNNLNFPELSSKAYFENHQEKDAMQKNNLPQEHPQDSVKKVKDNQVYTKNNFFDEIYLEEEDYNTLCTLVEYKKNIILQGAPGVGKTFIAKQLAWAIMGEKNEDRILTVQFHQSYAYEDFIMGYRPTKKGFELKTGAFYDFCKKAEKNPNHKYFCLIDEINRGNISKIFGELFMLIESDKRGEKLQLLYRNELFSIPENLYIIGTMNTADRSLAMLDYALRRRFAFFELQPAFENEKFKAYYQQLGNQKIKDLIKKIIDLNKKISEDDTLGEGFGIGHSYFCNLQSNGLDDKLTHIVDYELIPMLKEYWFDEPSKVDDCRNKLKNE